MMEADAKLAAAFNEWMRRYEEEPERFEREARSLKDFRASVAKGEEPTYGTCCVDYLNKILVDLDSTKTVV